jgi:hypothetical protein
VARLNLTQIDTPLNGKHPPATVRRCSSSGSQLGRERRRRRDFCFSPSYPVQPTPASRRPLRLLRDGQRARFRPKNRRHGFPTLTLPMRRTRARASFRAVTPPLRRKGGLSAGGAQRLLWAKPGAAGVCSTRSIEQATTWRFGGAYARSGNRAGRIPVRDYRFAWQSGVVIAEAPHRTSQRIAAAVPAYRFQLVEQEPHECAAGMSPPFQSGRVSTIGTGFSGSCFSALGQSVERYVGHLQPSGPSSPPAACALLSTAGVSTEGATTIAGTGHAGTGQADTRALCSRSQGFGPSGTFRAGAG